MLYFLYKISIGIRAKHQQIGRCFLIFNNTCTPSKRSSFIVCVHAIVNEGYSAFCNTDDVISFNRLIIKITSNYYIIHDCLGYLLGSIVPIYVYFGCHGNKKRQVSMVAQRNAMFSKLYYFHENRHF